jgi:hypothetical protein
LSAVTVGWSGTLGDRNTQLAEMLDFERVVGDQLIDFTPGLPGCRHGVIALSAW